jgi:hypothetical protein
MIPRPLDKSAYALSTSAIIGIITMATNPNAWGGDYLHERSTVRLVFNLPFGLKLVRGNKPQNTVGENTEEFTPITLWKILEEPTLSADSAAWPGLAAEAPSPEPKLQ